MIETMRETSRMTADGAWQHSEGKVARALEKHTAKLPSDIWLWGALGSMAASLALQFAGRNHESLFVGQWVPSFLLIRIYNKIVKFAGSDSVHHSYADDSCY